MHVGEKPSPIADSPENRILDAVQHPKLLAMGFCTICICGRQMPLLVTAYVEACLLVCCPRRADWISS